jgi:hypothetical protein
MIEYRFRVPSAAVFTPYSYSKALEYRFRVPTAGSLIDLRDFLLQDKISLNTFVYTKHYTEESITMNCHSGDHS